MSKDLRLETPQEVCRTEFREENAVIRLLPIDGFVRNNERTGIVETCPYALLHEYLIAFGIGWTFERLIPVPY